MLDETPDRMPDRTGIQLYPPSDWQAFERLCHSLWKEIWGDPNTQLNGRAGQPQAGVDVYGTARGDSRPSGVQCKGRDGRFGAYLSEADLRDEVEKAKTFTPPLRQFIVATTANSDEDIQSVARSITESHIKEGLFTVSVLGWQEIHLRLVEFPKVLESHYPEFHSKLDDVVAGIEKIQISQEQSAQIQSERHEQLIAAILSGRTSDRTIDEQLDAELDQYRDLIKEGKASTAIGLLEKLRDRLGAGATIPIRFRILTNLGAAKLSVDRGQEAASDFLSAYELQPTSEKALTNRAVAYLALDERASAIEAAERAVATFPKSPSTWAILISARSDDLDSVRSLAIPEEIAGSEEVLFALADAYLRGDDNDSAEEYFRRALTVAPNSVQARIGLGTALAKQAAIGGKLYSGLTLPEDAGRKLREAKGEMEAAWNFIKTRETAIVATEFAFNFSSVLMSLSEYDAAEKVVDTVLGKSPIVLRQKLRLLLETGRNADAERLLSQPGSERIPQYHLLKAEVLRRHARFEEALTELDESTNDSKGGADSEDVGPAYIEIAVEALGLEKGLIRAAKFVEIAEKKSWGLLALAGVYRRHGRSHDSVDMLRRAILLCKESNDRQLIMLATDQLFDLGEIEESLALYREYCPKDNDSPSLRRLLGGLLQSGHRRECADLLARLPQELHAAPFYSRIEAELAFQSGETSRAKTLFDRLGSRRDAQFNDVARIAAIEARGGDSESALRRLRGVDPRSLGSAELVPLGQLFREVGSHEEALKTLYAAQRRFPNEPKAQMAFVGTVLFASPDLIPNDPEASIRPDFAFSVIDEGGRQRQYIIEGDPALELAAGEISETHPIAQRAIGKKAGESLVMAENSFGKEVATIQWVKHKYLHAAHEIMETFESRFPGVPGFQRVKVTTGEGPEGLRPILDSIDRRAQSTAEIERLYVENRLPLAMVARLSGNHVIDVWRSWISSPDKKFLVCAGSGDERARAIELLRSAHRIIVEPLSLYLLHSLKLLDLVRDTYGPIGVAQSTIDTIRELAGERALHSDGFMSIGKTGGEYVRQEISPAQIQSDIDDLTTLVTWIDAHCEIIPSIPKADIREKDKLKVVELLGDDYRDVIYSCSGAEGLLLSDDWHLRVLAKELLGVDGIWTQTLLIDLRANGKLTSVEYSQAISALASANFSFTSLDGDVIFWSIRSQQFAATDQLKRTLAALRGAMADVAALATVLARALGLLWSTDEAEDSDKRRITHLLLESCEVAVSPNRMDLLRRLAVFTKLDQLPRSAFSEVFAWYRGHFLLKD